MINTARYKNYGQMNEQANGETIADEYVWQGGTLVKQGYLYILHYK